MVIALSDFHKMQNIVFKNHLKLSPNTMDNDVRDKVCKNGPSKICGRQPSTNFTWPILEYFACPIC